MLMHQHVIDYSEKLARALKLSAMGKIPVLGEALRPMREMRFQFAWHGSSITFVH